MANMAFRKMVDSAWAQSCQLHHADVTREYDNANFSFTSRLYKLTRIITACLPWVSSWHRQVALRKHGEVAEIVQRYAPAILDGLNALYEGFQQWERENAEYGCGTKEASLQEDSGRSRVADQSEKMLEELKNVRYLRFFFSGFLNPRKLVRSPYPGYLSTATAEKYVQDLMAEFLREDKKS